MAGFGEWMWGAEDKFNKLDTMNPQQKQMFQQLYDMISGGGQMGQGSQAAMQHQQQMLDPSSEAYKKMAQPYMNEFEQQTVPGLAERFAGMGGGLGGGTSSSGFGQALSSAGSNLQQNLAGMKTGMQSQAANSIMQQFMQMMGVGLGKDTFAYGHQPASAGFAANTAGKFAQGFWQGFGGTF